MQPIMFEWISKAEGGFATLQREIQVVDFPNYEGICFHAQQVNVQRRKDNDC